MFVLNHDPETGVMALQYEEIYGDDFVSEFLVSTDWWDGSWNGEPFQVPPLETNN